MFQILHADSVNRKEMDIPPDCFIESLKQKFANNEYIVCPKIRGNTWFDINHTASAVSYESSEFIDKNKNEIPVSIASFIKNCDSDIRFLFE